MKASPLAALALAALALAGCDNGPKAPTDRGVCWHMVWEKDGSAKFNKLAVNQPSLEYCAAKLELMRLNFAALGSPRETVTGAYQGRFIFVERRGIFSGTRYEGSRFLTLMRAPGGRLVVPGALREPTVAP